MQNIMEQEIFSARKERMKKLEDELREFIKGCVVGEKVICPKCNYQSKNNKTSAVIFKDSIKCFACGFWRKI